MPNFGFGNKLLYYFYLRQLSYELNEDFYCVPWDGYQYFNGNLLGNFDASAKPIDLSLGDHFFKFNKIKTRDIFQLKNKKNISDNTAIHFRGTDFFLWNPDSILSEEYYINSIEETKKITENYIIFSDDLSLKSYLNVIKYLKQNSLSFSFGQNTNNRSMFIEDFCLMAECDNIISSPSTYCISAGFIGKNKKIIHSEQWIKSRILENDNFWIDLNNGGNFNYCLWKKV